jgi:predicted transcriptional regulator
MTADELINHMIPPLKTSDDAHKAIVWMEELRCNQLPVVEDRKFVGLLSEEMILEENTIDKLVGDYAYECAQCAVKEGSHFYEVLKLASDHKVQTIGVINDEDQYVGAITVQDTITAFAQSAAVQLPGGIIVLSVNQIDYSLSQIARLIEENNAKILSSSVKIDELDPSKLRLTIKINRLELNHIAATLERFGYRIIARFQETNIQNEERERLDMLLKYLDI